MDGRDLDRPQDARLLFRESLRLGPRLSAYLSAEFEAGDIALVKVDSTEQA